MLGVSGPATSRGSRTEETAEVPGHMEGAHLCCYLRNANSNHKDVQSQIPRVGRNGKGTHPAAGMDVAQWERVYTAGGRDRVQLGA